MDNTEEQKESSDFKLVEDKAQALANQISSLKYNIEDLLLLIRQGTTTRAEECTSLTKERSVDNRFQIISNALDDGSSDIDKCSDLTTQLKKLIE